MSAQASGRLLAEHMPSLADESFRDPAVLVVGFDRVFDSSAETVWRWLIDPAYTTQWYGWWQRRGDAGELEFLTTGATGACTAGVQLVDYDPGRWLRVRFAHGKKSYFASLTLDTDPSRADAPTTLTCTQSFRSAEVIEHFGPAWDYYLDRLVAAHSGADPSTIRFEPDYRPDLVPHYQGLLRQAIVNAQAVRDRLRIDHAR